jgi:predicted NBD/HSP70 family sugar kinase
MSDLIGFDIGGTDIKLGVVSGDGAIVGSGRIPTRPREGPESAAARAVEWFFEHGIALEDAAAAGVACAGLIDRKKGAIIDTGHRGK